MKCLYCDRQLGFFNTSKSSFCSEQHEELYRTAAQQRLQAPYAPSAGALERSTGPEVSEPSRVQDIAQLLQATQVASGATVEAPAEVATTAASTESVAVGVSSAEATAVRVPSEMASLGNTGDRVDPVIGSAGNRAEQPLRPSDSSHSQEPPTIDFPLGPGPTHAATEDVEKETERRSEPRVGAVVIIKIATLRDPERDSTCALVNKSDAGIQFTSDDDFAIGEMLIAELPDQLVLAEVKHSEASGPRFAIGAERVQSASPDEVAEANNGMERAEVLIKALCDRVRTGFSDETGLVTDGAGSDHRERALQKVAKILEIWQSTKAQSTRAPAPAESSDESARASSTGGLKTLAAVVSGLFIAALLLVCVYEYRKSTAAPAPHEPVQSQQAAAPKVEPAARPAPEVSKPAETKTVDTKPPETKPVEVKHQAVSAPVVPPPAVAQSKPVVQAKPAPPAQTKPVTPPLAVASASAGAGPHHAQIKALATTWVGLSVDGHPVFGKMLTQGTTQAVEYSKFAFIHAGNASGIEITVDGQPVPMGSRSLRLVELNTTGFKILRWSNGDPAQP